MDEILNLLKERNSFLRQFYSINKTEIYRFEEGDFSRIESFYQSRDNLLDIISHLEEKLDAHIGAIQGGDVGAEIKEKVRSELDFKDSMITEILNQDLIILGKIDEAKTKIIKDLQHIAKNKNAVIGYHSESISKKQKR